MSQFVPRWSTWSPEMVNQATDKTDKSLTENSERPREGTAKADKRAFVSFGSSKPGGFDENQEAVSLPLSVDQVAGMKLDDFASAGLIVQVRSSVLAADVLFVSDNVPESKIEDRPEVVYRACELKKLARVPPDPRNLRTVHMVKEILGGTIQGVRDPADPADEPSVEDEEDVS